MTFARLLNTAIISFAFVFGFSNSYAKDVVTTDTTVLPQTAIAFLNNNFKDVKVAKIEIDKSWLWGTTYDVKLSNGIEIEFNKKGIWKGIESDANNVPLSVLPTPLADAVNKKVPNAKIESIERKGYGFKLELVNDTEVLVYDDLRVIVSKDY